MKSIVNPDILYYGSKLYLWIMAISFVIIAYYNKVLGAIGALILSYLLYYNFKLKNKRREDLKNYIENLSDNVDMATKNVILNLPFPLVISDENGIINWYNFLFSHIFQGDYLLNKSISSYIPDMDIERILNKDRSGYKNIKIREKYYDLYCEFFDIIESDVEKKIIVSYLVEKTDYMQLANRYLEEKNVLAIVQIDNLNEVLSNAEEGLKPIVLAELDRVIKSWASANKASIQKYSNGEYILHFSHKQLKSMEEKRFEILEDVREIDSRGSIPITLSIGVGVGGETHKELQDFAKSAMDIALGRGGDQAVVKNNEKLSFYGGKSKVIEKRTKVKARVIAHALKQLIIQSDEVFIMGHESQDLDCIGAALGIYRCCFNLGKSSYIILNSVNAGIENLWHEIQRDKEYENVFIKGHEALDMGIKNGLLIIVDVHRPSFTEEQGLLKKIDKKVIIDHHRRSSEFIDDAVLTYIEPYASSTSELVTEILQYMFEKPKIKQIEAEALLAGIFIDTKNFSFQTGARTFEAASFLRRAGADTILTKQLFQDDIETYIDRSEVVKKARMYKGDIAISVIPEGVKNPTLIAAQAADELLNIRGIKASFVLSRLNGNVFISGRSLGDINVQVVLEKLGGGGHLTVAGAQLSNISLNDAIMLVERALDDYIKEGV